AGAPSATPTGPPLLIETNIDDLDPRVWPAVIAALLSDGASDAWLTPILMKKGRPAHTLSVLCQPDLADELRQTIYTETTTLGIRHHTVRKHAALRGYAEITVNGDVIAIKLTHQNGRIVQAAPEFED